MSDHIQRSEYVWIIVRKIYDFSQARFVLAHKLEMP